MSIMYNMYVRLVVDAPLFMAGRVCVSAQPTNVAPAVMGKHTSQQKPPQKFALTIRQRQRQGHWTALAPSLS